MDQKLIVYIWDMDETLILLKSLTNGAFAAAFNGLKDVEKGIKLGELWENHILDVCDAHFFYEQIERFKFNQPYLDALSQYDDGIDLSNYNFSQDGFGPPMDDAGKCKLAYRHRVIAEKYRKAHISSRGLNNVLNPDFVKLWDSLYDLTDTYTDKWLSSARACLEQCAGQRRDTEFQHVNVLVTAGPLVPSLGKCLFFRLDDMISCNNVYSSLDTGKLQCFLWIKERFPGTNTKFCVIGDGLEECGAAETMKWPFVQIDPRPSGIHRFPGLTSEDIRHYLSVVYGTDEE